MNMETHLLNDPSLGRVFAGWNNLDFLYFEASRRSDAYLSVGPDWGNYEASEFILLETPPVYDYYSYE